MSIIQNSVLKSSPLAEGGEGIIYEYQGSILKVYKPTVDIKEKQAKCERLVTKHLPSNVIGPKDLAFDQNNKFIGFIMDRVEGEDFRLLSNKKYVKMNNISNKQVVDMLLQCKNTLKVLHAQNVVIGDLNDLNILFDKNFQVFFIDVDSWAVDGIKCHVAMDAFKDPLVPYDNFTPESDAYSFSIIAFKGLTRIHPFGGTSIPDMSMTDRMAKGISVIDNKNVIIPTLANKWDFFSPDYIAELKDIFEKQKRSLTDRTLEDFGKNMKFCDTHKDFYYGKFDKCPICFSGAQASKAPQRIDDASGIPYVLVLQMPEDSIIVDDNTCISGNKYVVNIKTKDQIRYVENRGLRYYFPTFDDKMVIVVGTKSFKIFDLTDNSEVSFNKLYRSPIQVMKDGVCYVSENNELLYLVISRQGNYTRSLGKVAFRNYFHIIDKDTRFVCNQYDGLKIINVDGYNIEIKDDKVIQDYGIHYDSVTKSWLFVMLDQHNKFTTYVFSKDKILLDYDNISYGQISLGNICFNSGMIFIPGNKKIRGYSYAKNAFRDFICEPVTEDSRLVRKGNKFIVYNDNEIYEVG